MEIIRPTILGAEQGDSVAHNLVGETWRQPWVTTIAGKTHTPVITNAGDKPAVCAMTPQEFRKKLDEAGVSEADMRRALVDLMKKSFSTNDSSFDALTATLALHAVKESLVQYYATGSSIPIKGFENCRLPKR